MTSKLRGIDVDATSLSQRRRFDVMCLLLSILQSNRVSVLVSDSMFFFLSAESSSVSFIVLVVQVDFVNFSFRRYTVALTMEHSLQEMFVFHKQKKTCFLFCKEKKE